MINIRRMKGIMQITADTFLLQKNTQHPMISKKIKGVHNKKILKLIYRSIHKSKRKI